MAHNFLYEQQTRQEREQEHRQNENIVSTYSRLGNETLLLLHYLTANDISSLLEPEMLARLAQLLNYFLMSLAGPKRKELSVNANDKLHFSPRTLLASLCEIYVSLDRQCGDQFLNALVNDPRAFKIDIFTSCVQIVTSKSILKEPSLGQFIAVVKKLEAKATEQKGEEDIAAEAPDEFLDPLLATLMTDPGLSLPPLSLYKSAAHFSYFLRFVAQSLCLQEWLWTEELL
jgi:ubiquitin conjugation factor E4 B